LIVIIILLIAVIIIVKIIDFELKYIEQIYDEMEILIIGLSLQIIDIIEIKYYYG
jgi:hypothetical protein